MYEKGLGVPKDYVQAIAWYREAADQGYASAHFNLGNMYYYGRGIPQDYAQAGAWYSKAAGLGDADAQSNLGTMFYFGQGMPQDYIQAHKWLNLAASRFDSAEKEKRDRAVKARDAVAAHMTPAQIGEAQKLASEWKPTQ